jgi:hypothetical protein
VEGDIRPFRGLLLALFFMTVGMNINLGMLAERGPLQAGLLVTLLLTKAGILTLVSRGFGLALPAAASVGVMLAQGGEFGFVLFALSREALLALEDQLSSRRREISFGVVPTEVSWRRLRKWCSPASGSTNTGRGLPPAGEPAPGTGEGDREQPSRAVKTAQAKYRMGSPRLPVFGGGEDNSRR